MTSVATFSRQESLLSRNIKGGVPVGNIGARRWSRIDWFVLEMPDVG
jgi:hypothetical protein